MNFSVESVIKSLMSCICCLHMSNHHLCWPCMQNIGSHAGWIIPWKPSSFTIWFFFVLSSMGLKSKQGLSLFFNICLSDVLKHRILHAHLYTQILSVLWSKCSFRALLNYWKCQKQNRVKKFSIISSLTAGNSWPQACVWVQWVKEVFLINWLLPHSCLQTKKWALGVL